MLIGSVAGLACRGEEERARQGEAAALVRAINQLRDAPNEAKRPLHKALDQLPCGSDDLCDLKRICYKAYLRHIRALDSARALRHALADGGIVAPAASAEAVQLADDAQRYLERARFLNRRCVRLQGQIERAYGL